jgi:hypothetical protein
MQISRVLLIVSACVAVGGAECGAEPVWATGNTLKEVIRYDLEAHDTGQKLTDYQINAVCLLLGYFTGFAESSALAAHYDATALPFFLPDSITNDEIERSVYKYLEDNPDKLTFKGAALVVAALTRDFPNPVFKPPRGPVPGG